MLSTRARDLCASAASSGLTAPGRRLARMMCIPSRRGSAAMRSSSRDHNIPSSRTSMRKRFSILLRPAFRSGALTVRSRFARPGCPRAAAAIPAKISSVA